MDVAHRVGAAEGCDLLILIFSDLERIKIKRSQPSAAPTENRATASGLGGNSVFAQANRDGAMGRLQARSEQPAGRITAVKLFQQVLFKVTNGLFQAAHFTVV